MIGIIGISEVFKLHKKHRLKFDANKILIVFVSNCLLIKHDT